jgi:predicted dehydrogenase
MRIGLVGCGNISDTHARAARSIPGVEIVALFGRTEEKAEHIAALHGGTVYTDFDAFLRHAPMDVVAIGSPSGLHAEQAAAAARAGFHVLVEKPLDVSTERIDRLIAAADRAGVQIGVFFQDRLKPDVRVLSGLISSGALGRPILATGQVKWYRPPDYYAGSRWRGTWAGDGGGALMNQGIHTADLLLAVLGPVRRVSAATATGLHDIEVEDTAVAVLQFANGAVGTLEATTTGYPGFPRRVEVTGTEGTAVLVQDRLISVDLRNARAIEGWEPSAEDAANQSASSPTVADPIPHRRIFEDFFDAVASGRRPCCDGREGRRSVALVEAIYRAARTGTPVEVDGWATAE